MIDCNQFIIKNRETDELALFDAGNGLAFEGLINGMKNIGLNYENITKVFLTHEHVDHVLGLYPLMERLEENPPEIYAYGETAKIIKTGDVAQMFPGSLGLGPSNFGIEIKPHKVTDLLNKAKIEVFSNYKFQIHHTPGHSVGSICYYEPDKKILICGDLIFPGGNFGRYDFPGGSLETLQKSIKFITTLDVKYLMSGHVGFSDNGNKQIEFSYKMANSIGSFF